MASGVNNKWSNLNVESISNINVYSTNASLYEMKMLQKNDEDFATTAAGGKKSSTNLTPCESMNKKKKRFSNQKSSNVATSKKTKLTDLPLLPLSYICSHLTLIEREMFSQANMKFAIADQIAWIRRSRFNIKADICANLLEFSFDNVMFDDTFEFVSLSLLGGKVQLISTYFTSNRSFCIDFSTPNCALKTKKWGEMVLMNRATFRASLESFSCRKKVVELNLRDAFVTKDVLHECTSLFPHLTSITLSLHSLVREHQSDGVNVGSSNRLDVMNEKYIKNWKPLSKRIQPRPQICDLLSLLYVTFPSLTVVILFD